MNTAIVEFLTARLDEDEQAAQAASERAPWSHNADDYWMITGTDGEVVVYDESAPTTAEAVHIARHDPTRVLAEVAAKRAILAEHLPGTDRCDEHDAMLRTIPCPTLLALVGPYSEHPHCHPAWAP